MSDDRKNGVIYCVVCASLGRRSWWPQGSEEHERLHKEKPA